MQTHPPRTDAIPKSQAIGAILHYILIIFAALLLVFSPYLEEAIKSQNRSFLWLLIGPAIFSALFAITIFIEFLSKQKVFSSAYDYIFVLFGVLMIAMLIPKVGERRPHNGSLSINEDLINQFYEHHDPRIRALAVLASASLKSTNSDLGALIHRGLLDKDPLVQQAAKLVIENNFELESKRSEDNPHSVSSSR
jgi:drug/metabolite transporter superfamily protein YnfA